MPHSSRDRAKEPNPEIGIENTEPLEQRPPRLRARGDPDLVGLIKNTRSSLTRRASTSKALTAPSIESYIHSPSSSRSRSTTKKLKVNRPTGHNRPGTLNSDSTREATCYIPSPPSTSQKPELRNNPEAQPENPGEGTSSETSSSTQSYTGTTNRVTMSVERLPPFVRGPLNKAECGPTSCGVRQTVLAQNHQGSVQVEKVLTSRSN